MNLAAVYPEMQSDFDFCLDTIKAFCASNFILRDLLLRARLIFETAMVCIESGYVLFHRETLIFSCTWVGQGPMTLGQRSGYSRGVKVWSGLAARLGEGTARS